LEEKKNKNKNQETNMKFEMKSVFKHSLLEIEKALSIQISRLNPI
jgi:hypothetical protein